MFERSSRWLLGSLAMAAALKGHKHGPLLAAESLDRLLVALERPQVFGTQPVEDKAALPDFGALPKRFRAKFGVKKKR